MGIGKRYIRAPKFCRKKGNFFPTLYSWVPLRIQSWNYTSEHYDLSLAHRLRQPSKQPSQESFAKALTIVSKTVRTAVVTAYISKHSTSLNTDSWLRRWTSETRSDRCRSYHIHRWTIRYITDHRLTRLHLHRPTSENALIVIQTSLN